MKKRCLLVCVLIMCIVFHSLVFAASAVITPVYGDADKSGTVDAVDALYVLNCSVGNVNISEEMFIYADVNGDNNVDSIDAYYVLLKTVGKIDYFPAERQSQFSFAEMRFNNSILVQVQTEKRVIPANEFCDIALRVLEVQKSQTTDGLYSHELVLFLREYGEEAVKQAIEKAQEKTMVISADFNKYAVDYKACAAKLKLMQSEVTIPVGETAEIVIEEYEPRSNEEVLLGVIFEFDTAPENTEQAISEIRWETDLLNIQSTAPNVYTGYFKNELRSSDSKIDVFEYCMDYLNRRSEIARVELQIDIAAAGNPYTEEWRIENENIAAFSLQGGQESYCSLQLLNYTALVTGLKPGRTVLSVNKMGFGTNLTAKCIINVVPEGDEFDVVEINGQNFPDEVFIEDVRGFDTDKNGYLSNREIAAVKKLDLFFGGRYYDYQPRPPYVERRQNAIHSLKGIEYFTSLESLDCSNNPIDVLDLSRVPSIINLTCDGCSIKELITGRHLLCLNCNYNNFETLDLKRSVELQFLSCADCNLSTLDVAENKSLVNLNCSHNDLIDLRIDKNRELEKLDCSFNNLSFLSVGRNTKLVELICNDNNLSYLYVFYNTELYWLYCYNNGITELNVSKNLKLETLRTDEGVNVIG